MEEKDPDELVQKAKKKLDPGFFKSIFTDSGHRLEKATNYFTEAAEIYKNNFRKIINTKNSSSI